MTSAEAAREAYRGDNARDQDGLLEDQDMEMDPQQVESTLEAYAEVINLDNEGTHDNLQLIDWILQVSKKIFIIFTLCLILNLRDLIK